MRRRAVLLAAVALVSLVSACSAVPGASPLPTAVVSTSPADPFGLGSVPWPQDDDSATSWLDRLPDEVQGLAKVPTDEATDDFGFVVYRSGPEEDDRSVSWFAGGGLDGLLGILDFGDGARPCERWASSPSLATLSGLAGPELNRAVSELPEPLPEAVPWWSCAFTTDETGETLGAGDWEWFATWVSGDRSFTVSTADEAERDALVRAAIQAAAG